MSENETPDIILDSGPWERWAKGVDKDLNATILYAQAMGCLVASNLAEPDDLIAHMQEEFPDVAPKDIQEAITQLHALLDRVMFEQREILRFMQEAHLVSDEEEGEGEGEDWDDEEDDEEEEGDNAEETSLEDLPEEWDPNDPMDDLSDDETEEPPGLPLMLGDTTDINNIAQGLVHFAFGFSRGLSAVFDEENPSNALLETQEFLGEMIAHISACMEQEPLDTQQLISELSDASTTLSYLPHGVCAALIAECSEMYMDEDDEGLALEAANEESDGAIKH